jgi:hypothetical protein
VSLLTSSLPPVQASSLPSYFAAVGLFCVATLLAFPALAQGEKTADEGESTQEGEGSKKEEGTAPAATPKAATPKAVPVKPAEKKAAAKVVTPGGPDDQPVEGPENWPPGKPPGPGPQGWPDGKTAADFDNPDEEAPGGGPDGWSPEDGIGVGCKDYIECVCKISELTGGQTMGGYNHAGTCTVAKTYTTPEYEGLCAEELDQLKEALEDAKEDYKANGIKLPASCL